MEVLHSILGILAFWFFFYMHLVTWRRITGYRQMNKVAELTLDDLRKITWDYALEGVVGLYNGKIIRQYLFDVKECGDVNVLAIQKCNVAEGWVEQYEFVEPPYIDENGKPRYSMPKFTPDFEPMRTKVNCKVVLDLLDSSGRVILTLRS